MWPSRNPVMFVQMLVLLCTIVFECFHRCLVRKDHQCHRRLLYQVPSSVDVGRNLPSCLMLFRILTPQRSKESLFERRYLWWIQALVRRRCETWSTQPCHVCAQSARIFVLFSRVLLLGHLLFLVRVLQVRPHSVECGTHCSDWLHLVQSPILVGLHFVPSTQWCLLFHSVVPSNTFVIQGLFHSVAPVTYVSNSIVCRYHFSQTAVLAFRCSAAAHA